MFGILLSKQAPQYSDRMFSMDSISTALFYRTSGWSSLMMWPSSAFTRPDREVAI
jgi:hypothetical protein